MTKAEIIRDSREKGLTMIQIIDRLIEQGHLTEKYVYHIPARRTGRLYQMQMGQPNIYQLIKEREDADILV